MKLNLNEAIVYLNLAFIYALIFAIIVKVFFGEQGSKKGK